MCKKETLEFLKQFFVDFDYPAGARDAFLAAWETFCEKQEFFEELSGMIRLYEEDMLTDFDGLCDRMKTLCEKAGVHVYTGHMLLMILLAKPLQQYYVQKGVDLKIWKNSMYDLKYKVIECDLAYGIWGTFVVDWFGRFYQLTRFAFGKLQFEPVKFGRHYEKNGLVLTPDSIVLNVHIPRTGEPLDKTSRDYAYSHAAEFYQDLFVDRPVVFVCGSWLLFEKHKEILKPGCNVLGFMSDYEILETGEYKDYSSTWRLFGTMDYLNLDKLPYGTSFERAYVDLMRRGEKTGWSYGIFVFPGC